MKIFAVIVLLLLPTAALAQNNPNYQNMSEQDMQQMTQNAQKMQECMRNIDQDKLDAIDRLSEEKDDEIKALCAEGKRDEAQAKAMAFGEKMAKDPTMQEMRKCGELYKGMGPKTSLMDQYQKDEKDGSTHHVCDRFKEEGY